MPRLSLLVLLLATLCGCAAPIPTAIDTPAPTPTFTPLPPTPIPTETPTATPNPYESLTNINPSELTIESFLNVMPANIKATHENPSFATQEQKDAHDQWISDAWKAIFNNLTDAQLSQMNLKRADISKLGLGPTGTTYTEVDGKQYPIYDYSLVQAMEAFSQEFQVYQAPFMINLGEQIKVDPKNWIDYHVENTPRPSIDYGYGYGSSGLHFTHDRMMIAGYIVDRSYFGKTIKTNDLIARFAFSGDLPLVFDYPGFPNSYIGLISMRDTDVNNKVERYNLVL